MTLDAPTTHVARCPICMDSFQWPRDNVIWLYEETKSEYQEFNLSDIASSAKQVDLRRQGYIRCPNPSQDTRVHYLPATYHAYQEPLVIGLVGAPKSGKTHLLTAMIREAHQGGLAAHGVSLAPLDFRRHNEFRRSHIEPFERGAILFGTEHGVIEYTDTLLLSSPAGTRPVTFFDIAGEDLQNINDQGKSGRFLIGAGALIFVHPLEDESDATVRSSEYRVFSLAVERAKTNPDFTQLPAAIVVTKADRLRYVPPADRWLRRSNVEGALNAELIRAESSDVFAYLHHHQDLTPLSLFHTFTRCTLHFVSSSGGDASGDSPETEKFERGIRPMRVLQPLIAILAMAGIITGAEAKKVGE
ncbi:MAG: hypothetical protein LC799_04230 [Actinobacteria bacterium]|nr:hypothetical protein [Actinomycetota bacterium]